MNPTLNKSKPVGLALGGGAVLGAAHVGVLKALEEHNLEISHLAGTSIGAFVAAFYAFGIGLKEIEKIATELKWIDLASISLSRYGLLSTEKMGDLVSRHLGNRRIEDSEIPLAMIATNATSGEKVILDKGPVAEAVMASTCIPGIFIPVKVDNRMLVDGGIVENVPIHTVRNMGAEQVIGVDLNATHTYEEPGNILDVLLNSFHFVMMTASKLQTEQADLLIQPDLSDFNRSDTDQVKDLIRQGYNDTLDVLKNQE